MSTRLRTALAALVLAALASSAARAATPGAGGTIYMVGINAGEGLSEKALRTLEETFLTALHAGQLRVLGGTDVARLIGFEKQRQLLGCSDVNCAVELAGALGASFLIAGDVGVLGTRYVFNAKVIDVRAYKATIRAMRTATHADGLQTAVGEAAAEIAARMLGRPVPERGVPAADSRLYAQAPLPRELLVRFGFGAHNGVFGLGLEYRLGFVGLAIGAGTHLLGGGVSFARPGGGPYVDLHALLARTGPLLLGDSSRAVREGWGAGVTAGWDFRPTKRLSLKAGAGAAWNSANDGDLSRLLVLDASAGFVF